jgi:hypothetical protein
VFVLSRRRGNDYENQVCDMADALGYCSFPARGSRGIVDIIAFEDVQSLPELSRYDDRAIERQMAPLAIQVGTTAKAISKTLDELDAAPRPIGSLCLVARRHRNPKSKRISWTFHTAKGKFTSLLDAVQT